MNVDIYSALSGGILVGYWAIGVFFFRFRRKSHDRFFAYFGWSFWILAVERVLLIMIGQSEVRPYYYLLRLVAFLFILYAIYDKNRAGKPLPPGTPKLQ